MAPGPYWQAICGIALTGVVDEQILPVLYGTGSNGKSTIILTLLGMLGPDYAMKAPQDFLTVRSHEPHPTELADLHGKRLVTAIETGEDIRLNEVRAKELTGKDIIRARRMREDFWEFLPTHKLWLATNHRPLIRGTDHAIWRRIREIPFTVAIPEAKAIKHMDQILAGEYSGILNWCIEGCRRWQREGLHTPAAVTAATTEYKNEQDIFLEFCEAACVVASAEKKKELAATHITKIHNFKIKAGTLNAALTNWLANNTSRGPVAPHKFRQMMIDHGYEPRLDNSKTTWYVGITTRVDFHRDSHQPPPND